MEKAKTGKKPSQEPETDIKDLAPAENMPRLSQRARRSGTLKEAPQGLGSVSKRRLPAPGLKPPCPRPGLQAAQAANILRRVSRRFSQHAVMHD
jgi:hypothetical protein